MPRVMPACQRLVPISPSTLNHKPLTTPMIETLKAHFPKLSDTAAAAIVFAFSQWWLDAPAEINSLDFEEATLIGFAAGWLARPADYTS